MVQGILVLEHDPVDPIGRLGDWLTEAGAELTVCRPHAGDPIPETLIRLRRADQHGWADGRPGRCGAPWLPATRRLLAAAVSAATPTLGVCLGGQLLAAATGGTVRVGTDGPEIGAYLTAKRDAAMSDPLFADLPMTPDVMQYHDDVGHHPAAGCGAAAVLDGLPAPGVAAGVGRVGPAVPRRADRGGRPRVGAPPRGQPLTGRLGPMLDDAEEAMGQVWREFAHRFVAFAQQAAPPGRTMLPVVAIDR